MITTTYSEAQQIPAQGAFSFVIPAKLSLFGTVESCRVTVQFHYPNGCLRHQPEYIAPYGFYGFEGR